MFASFSATDIDAAVDGDGAHFDGNISLFIGTNRSEFIRCQFTVVSYLILLKSTRTHQRQPRQPFRLI